MKQITSTFLFLILSLVFANYSLADTNNVVVQGQSSTHVSVQTTVGGSGTTYTHIQSTVNGQTQTFDTNQPGAYNLDNSAPGTQTTNSDFSTPTQVISPTSSPSATPAQEDSRNLKTLHKGLAQNIKSIIIGILQKLFSFFRFGK